ncbi:hypothetical protein PTKIN_Ptkin13bG0034000 [Pterospermum kingtungense]
MATPTAPRSSKMSLAMTLQISKKRHHKLIWRFTRNGEFLVKSSYHLARGFKDHGDEEHNESREGNNEDVVGKILIWKKVWKAQVPNKIKNFGWQICQEIIAVYTNLAKRKIPIPIQCPRCRKEDETVIHALRDCELAQEVWQLSEVKDYWLKLQGTQMFSWLENVMSKADEHSFDLGLMTIWSIWNARNAAVKCDEKRLATKVIHQAVSLLREFKEI